MAIDPQFGGSGMAHPAGEGSVQLRFDRRLKLEFHGSNITSDAGLLAYRELDEALGLRASAGAALSDLRRGRNRRHVLTRLPQQSIFGLFARYEDVNDAEHLSVDPALERCRNMAPNRSAIFRRNFGGLSSLGSAPSEGKGWWQTPLEQFAGTSGETHDRNILWAITPLTCTRS